MAIKKIEEQKRLELENNSVKSLPNNPSQQGYSPEAIKRKMYEPILGNKSSLVTEINRIVDEMNEEALGFLVTDHVTRDINLIMTKAMDASFSAPANSIVLSIPKSEHGYYSGINFKITEDIPSFEIVNDSGMDLKLVRYNQSINEITLRRFTTVNMSFYSDGINVYCYFMEVA